MSVSPTSSVYPPYYNQIAGSIGPVPVTNPTNAGGPTPPPAPPPGQGNQTTTQVTPSSSTSPSNTDNPNQVNKLA